MILAYSRIFAAKHAQTPAIVVPVITGATLVAFMQQCVNVCQKRHCRVRIDAEFLESISDLSD